MQVRLVNPRYKKVYRANSRYVEVVRRIEDLMEVKTILVANFFDNQFYDLCSNSFCIVFPDAVNFQSRQRNKMHQCRSDLILNKNPVH